MKTKIFVLSLLLLLVMPTLGLASVQKQQGVHEAGTGLQVVPINDDGNSPITIQIESTSVSDELEEVDYDSLQPGIHEAGTGLVNPKLKDEVQAENQVNANVQARMQERQEEKYSNQRAVERRSQVATAVQTMLKVADRNQSGLGEQVREIAQAQNQIQQNAEAKLEKVQNRNSFLKFLIGPKYSDIKNIEEQLAEHKTKVEELKQLKTELSQADASIIDEQIQKMEEVSLELQAEVNKQNKTFSLFGWLNRLINN